MCQIPSNLPSFSREMNYRVCPTIGVRPYQFDFLIHEYSDSIFSYLASLKDIIAGKFWNDVQNLPDLDIRLDWCPQIVTFS